MVSQSFKRLSYGGRKALLKRLRSNDGYTTTINGVNIMQVGYFAIGIGPTVDPEWVRTVATTAERLGFSTIWAPEHVVLLAQYASKYPYSSGDFPAPTDT